MFEKLRNYKSLLSEIRRTKSLPQTPEGKSIVKIGVDDPSAFLSGFSVSGSPVLSSDAADLITRSVKGLMDEDGFCFEISAPGITPSQQEAVRHAIPDYFRYEFLSKAREMTRNTWASIIMIIASALIFAINIFLRAHNYAEIINTMLDVVAWVPLWEATTLLFIDRPVLRFEQRKNSELIKSDFIFKP